MATLEQGDEMAVDDAPQAQRLRSVVSSDRRQKGRGFAEGPDARAERYGGGNYESLETSTRSSGATKSVEGWVIFVTGVHEEAQEEDIQEVFAEFGNIKNIYLNLDRQTGYVKGYALVEYANKGEAAAAIEQMDGKEVLTQAIHVTWAFSSGPAKSGRGRPRR
jgi:RNA-binding protein 8A